MSNITAAEKHQCDMFLRYMRKEPIERKDAKGNWSMLPIGNRIYGDVEYRVHSVKLIIPWDVIKAEFKYAAMDKKGYVYVYTTRPKSTDTYWISSNSHIYLEALNIDTYGVIWDRSLVERPD